MMALAFATFGTTDFQPAAENPPEEFLPSEQRVNPVDSNFLQTSIYFLLLFSSND
jgi:hypothetical protein